MPPETKLLKLAVMAYEAASEPDLWPDFLKCYTEAVDGEFTVLQVHDLGRHDSQILSGFGLSDRFMQSYNRHYSRINVWRERGRGLYIAGNVNLDAEYCPRPVFEQSEFYNDYMRLIGGHYSMAAVIRREGDLAPTLSTQRGPAKGPFGRDEREVARFLLPHLNRAWEVVKQRELLAAGEAVLDAVNQGVVFLKDGGTAIHWNRVAEDIFRANDGLALRDGRFCAADRMADAHLRRAIRCALSPDRPAGPIAVLIPRSTPLRDYQALAAPLRAGFRQFAGTARPAAVVVITDPEQQNPATADLLVKMFQLTLKEAALAAKLLEGKTVEQAAEELAITYETARTHLRRIFSKTGVTRQTELLLLMGRLPACPQGQPPAGCAHG